MTSVARVYDDTPEPSAEDLAGWAEILDLPRLDWRVVRRLAGRVVALGVDPARAAKPAWVLKSGVGARHAAAFGRTLESAALLDRLAAEAHAPWLSPPHGSSWRAALDTDRALLAMPWREGEPLAAEGVLSGAAASRLRIEGVPRLVEVMAGLDALTPVVRTVATAPPFDRAGYQLRMTGRLAERLAVLVDADGLEPAEAAAINGGFASLLDDAPLTIGFSHGELTPYHVIDTGDGRVALIDLESMEPAGIRHVDLTVCAMRIWVLNERPDTAQALVAARQRDLGTAARRTFVAETSWQWVYAAVRTRQESMAWETRRAVGSLWSWALDPVLGRR